ncbi:MAG: DUF523 domain-containing protein [Candidatus Electronema sp. V4]|uniref:DUF523 domain-containing protein n=1 Tax=Candidatus Electronema sp. V4 TaxID=3454756 RepID=UPI00405561DA
MSVPKLERCIVSACLTGLCTRYDGRSKPDRRCLELLKQFCWLPVCPEQLGGLPTPRVPADLVGSGAEVFAGRAAVITKAGADVTRQFIAGAEAVLQIALAQDIRLALLKARSPSCGLTPQPGVTAALLLAHDIEIIEF